MKLFCIELAPLWIPLGKRIQTFSVLYIECIVQMMVPSLCLLIYLCFTSYYWIPMLYLLWFAIDKQACNQGGRFKPWIRNLSLFKHYANYFPIKLIKTAELPRHKNYLIGAHPHGPLCMGHFNCFATEGAGFSKKFPGVRPHFLTLEGWYRWPFFREIFMQLGCSAATNENLDYLLSKREGGNAAVIMIGGAAEVLLSRPGECVLIIKSRKGFVRAALRNGADLVPVFSFGEADILEQVANPPGSLLRRFQDTFKSYAGFPPAIFYGRGVFQYSFGLIPFRKPINVVVGKPIPVEKVDYPTREQVDELHAKYLESLKELFNKHKAQYNNDPNQELVFT